MLVGWATPPMKGLIWERECRSGSTVTADDAFERLSWHSVMSENAIQETLWNEFAGLDCGMRTGVPLDCLSLSIRQIRKSFAVPLLLRHQCFTLVGLLGCVVLILARDVPGRVRVSFKENSDYWRGLLGGLAGAA